MYVLCMCVFRWYTCAEVDEMSHYFESTPIVSKESDDFK